MKKVYVVIHADECPGSVTIFEDSGDASGFAGKSDYKHVFAVEVTPSSTFTVDTKIDGWSVGDILTIVDKEGYAPITLEKAYEILQTVIHKMDASIGINWTVIETHVDWIANEEGWSRRTKQFKVCDASSNQNSFGLTGIVLVAADGEAWEVGMNELNTRMHPQGDIVVMRTRSGCNEWDWAAIGAEIPRELSLATGAVIKELWGDARERSDDTPS